MLAVVVGVIAAVQLRQPGSWWVLAGAIVGVLAAVITIAFNVPLNNHLDGVNPVEAVGRLHRGGAYFTSWLTWNRVRTVTAFAAAALMLIGLRYRLRRLISRV